MVLDHEPKPVSQDVSIKIPSPDAGVFTSKIVPVAPAKPAADKPTVPPPAPKKVDDDEDVNPYAVVKESEEELREYEKHKPKFGEVDDKFKKSMRGPASATTWI